MAGLTTWRRFTAAAWHAIPPMAAAPVVGAGPTPGGGDDAVGGRRDEETTRSVHLRQVIGVLFWSLLFVFFFFLSEVGSGTGLFWWRLPIVMCCADHGLIESVPIMASLRVFVTCMQSLLTRCPLPPSPFSVFLLPSAWM